LQKFWTGDYDREEKLAILDLGEMLARPARGDARDEFFFIMPTERESSQTLTQHITRAIPTSGTVAPVSIVGVRSVKMFG